MTPSGTRQDAALHSDLSSTLARVAGALAAHAEAPPYDTSAYADADWAAALRAELPQDGWGADRVLELLAGVVVEHGLPSDQGAFCGWIFTSATDVPTAAQAVAARVGAQRYLLFANGMLEGVALDWLRQAFRLPDDMEGVFVSGGTSANIVALAAARQQAYEQVGVDPAFDGLAGAPAGTVYGSVESHHCVIKAAGALGIGRGQVRLVACDSRQRVDVQAIRAAIRSDRAEGRLPVAVVANAGSTNTGSIDPIAELADVCEEEGVWLHVDGAYGLPGILDERVADRYAGLERAQSACVDLHKWLNAPMGSGATFVRPHGLLARALTGEPAAYLEGQFVDGSVTSAWDSMGPPYHEASLELSATSRGLITWAALAEIGVSGFAERVRRHRDCAQLVHRAASDHPRLQSLVEPELSVACLRYVVDGLGDDALDELNAAILARLRIDGTHAPSGTTVHGVFTIRPCYLSAWSTEEHAAALVEAVVALGDELTSAPT